MYIEKLDASVYIDVSEEIKKSYGEKEYTFSKKKSLKVDIFKIWLEKPILQDLVMLI